MNKYESKREARKRNLTERMKPKLKEVFDATDKTGSSTLEISEFKNALNILNLQVPSATIDTLWEDFLQNSLESPVRKDINFEEFIVLYYKLLDSAEYQPNMLDFPVFDIIDNAKFAFVSNSKVKSVPLENRVKDESYYIRARIQKGYGLNVQENIRVLDELEREDPNIDEITSDRLRSIRDAWIWIKKCIEGAKSIPEVTLGLNKYISTKDLFSNDKPKMIYFYNYVESPERNDILKYLGWTQVGESKIPNTLNQMCSQLESEGNYHRAAAIACFHFDFERAYEALCKVPTPSDENKYLRPFLAIVKTIQKEFSKEGESSLNFEAFSPTENGDEISNKISDIIALKPKGSKLDNLKNYLNIVRISCSAMTFKDHYLRLISRFICKEDYGELSSEMKKLRVSFYDKLGFAFRFLSAQELTKKVVEIIDTAKKEGLIEGIIITGKSEDSIKILQSYLDYSSDIQSVALIGVYLRLFKTPKAEVLDEWLALYKDFINAAALWKTRIMLDKEIVDFEKQFADKKSHDKSFETSSYAASQRCYYCNNPLAHPSLMANLIPSKKGFSQLLKSEKQRLNCCPDCLKPLPTCAVCLLPVSVMNPYPFLQENIKKSSSKLDYPPTSLEEVLIWCQSCKHGGHYVHIEEWFREYSKCPITGCLCECALIDMVE